MGVFRPDLYRRQLTDLTPAEVTAMGVRALLLDVDNTLSLHHSQTPLPGIPEWLASMKQAGILLVIVSNARKSRVQPFADSLDLPFFWLCKKPLPFSILRGIRRLGVSKKQTMLCGDQLFTDMAAGFLAGTKKLLVTPAKPETGWSFRLRRRLEKPLLARYTGEEQK